MANVKIIRLIGEDVLAEVLFSPENILKIKNPVRIVHVPSKVDPTKPSIGFAPWAEYSADKEFTIEKSSVVCIMEPIKEFVAQYNTIFSGIITPTTQLII